MIYLLRHGLDDERYVGGYSDVSLIEEGIKQVEKSIPIIKNLNINKIYSSDVKRAIDTAKIVNINNYPIIVDSNLRELDKGLLNGKNKELLTDEESINLNTNNIYEKIGNGEALIDLYNRVKKLLDNGYFLDKDNCLIVTHRGFINMLYYILNNIKLDYDKEKFGVEHASLHELDLDKKIIRRKYV